MNIKLNTIFISLILTLLYGLFYNALMFDNLKSDVLYITVFDLLFQNIKRGIKNN